MKKNIVESWITTALGTLIGIFGGFTLWFEKTPLWGSIVMWVVAAIFIFADEKFIKGIADKVLKLK